MIYTPKSSYLIPPSWGPAASPDSGHGTHGLGRGPTVRDAGRGPGSGGRR